VSEVCGLFLKYSPGKVKDIPKSAEKSDAKALQLAAHSLKSSSACIGAMHLSALASSRSPLKRERAIYLQYLQYGHACQ